MSMTGGLANAAQQNIGGALGVANSVLTTNGTGQGLWGPPQYMPERAVRESGAKVVFSGMVEVVKVANGYIVKIGRREGYECDQYVASTAAEVNAIVQAQLVAFRLEDKS